MKVSKKVIGNLEKCYSVAPLTYKGKKHMLVAAEKVNQCRLYDLEGNQEEVIWEGPGGTMSMVQVPGSDGQFLATHKFYSPNDSKEAKIILAYPEDGEWKVRTLAELPFVHRFDIISRNGVNYVIACTLKSGHEYKEDWRSPGKIQVCVLPEDLSSVDEEHPLQFEVLKEGLLKNHGYCKAEVDGVLRFYVAANEGVFECIPPESEEGTWEIKQILDEEFKKVYTYEKDAEFAHGIWGGEIAGTQGVLIGHRKGERNLLFFRCTDPEKLTFTADLLDSDVGPANVLHYTNDGEDYILSANREIDEIALYKVEK